MGVLDGGRARTCAVLRLPEESKNRMESHGATVPVRRCATNWNRWTGEVEIVPGVRAIPAPGHTPGHLAVLLASEGQQLLNLGDAAVHPLHLEHPEWENGFDLAAGRAVATRRALLERAAAETCT